MFPNPPGLRSVQMLAGPPCVMSKVELDPLIQLSLGVPGTELSFPEPHPSPTNGVGCFSGQSRKGLPGSSVLRATPLLPGTEAGLVPEPAPAPHPQDLLWPEVHLWPSVNSILTQSSHKSDFRGKHLLWGGILSCDADLGSFQLWP